MERKIVKENVTDQEYIRRRIVRETEKSIPGRAGS